MKSYLEGALNSRLFTGESPFRGFLAEGAPDSRVAIITGPNASGKSLMVRMLAATLNEEKVEPLQVSMRYRTMGGIHRAFMFGNDEDQSTGATSLYAVQGALRTSRGREAQHWVMLDEPDIGLAEEYAAALGAHLAEFANDLPKAAKGFVLVTHSRALVRGFTAAMTAAPHFVHLEKEMSLDGWLASSSQRTIEELLALDDLGNKRHSALEAILRKARKS